MNETCNRERPSVAAEQPVAREALEAQLRVSSALGSTFAQLDVDPSIYVGTSLPELAANAPVAIAAHQAALQGEIGEYEHVFRGRLFACQVSPLRNAQGGVVGCVGLALDVTERRQAEQRLVWWLRQKLRDSAEHPRYILTDWGIGYRLATAPPSTS